MQVEMQKAEDQFLKGLIKHWTPSNEWKLVFPMKDTT